MDARLFFDTTTAEPIAFTYAPPPDRAAVTPAAPHEVSAPVDDITANALVERHRGLVRRIAWQVHSRLSSALDVEDLTQTGLVALIEAARGFEDRGTAAFATYAVTRVRGAMIDALRRHAATRRSAMRDRRRLTAARTSVEARVGRHASDAELATELGVDGRALASLTTAAHGTRVDGIDEVYSDRDASFADSAPDPYAELESHFRRTAVADGIRALPRREALVLQLYFVEELNLEEIGRTLDIGAARVCQIKKAALAKLRDSLEGWA